MVCLAGALLIGNLVRLVRAARPPFAADDMARVDSLFDVLSTRADSIDGGLSVPPETVHVGFGASFGEPPARSGEGRMWVFVDTLEKPVADFPIAINEADERTLRALPRIGPAMAARIIAYRDEHGPFGTADDLLEVRGIGPKTLEQLLPLITLEASPDRQEGGKTEGKQDSETGSGRSEQGP